MACILVAVVLTSAGERTHGHVPQDAREKVRGKENGKKECLPRQADQHCRYRDEIRGRHKISQIHCGEVRDAQGPDQGGSDAQVRSKKDIFEKDAGKEARVGQGIGQQGRHEENRSEDQREKDRHEEVRNEKAGSKKAGDEEDSDEEDANQANGVAQARSEESFGKKAGGEKVRPCKARRRQERNAQVHERAASVPSRLQTGSHKGASQARSDETRRHAAARQGGGQVRARTQVDYCAVDAREVHALQHPHQAASHQRYADPAYQSGRGSSAYPGAAGCQAGPLAPGANVAGCRFGALSQRRCIQSSRCLHGCRWQRADQSPARRPGQARGLIRAAVGARGPRAAPPARS
ncbi:MAG: hypothetical protein ABI300_04095 [Rhodanobacter sp.]